jgi:TctA family transporter
MIDAALSAFEALFSCPCHLGFLPDTFLFLFVGVVAGLALGLIPGLGGLVGMAILLPFTFDMQASAAFAMLVGMMAVTTTSDTIPAVLFSVPGSVGSQATILDGHPMARRGEAGRAFGAAYTASMIGGLFGALILAVSIPVLRPLVLLFGSPEFFMLGMLGIAMVAVLSGGAPIKGLVAAAIGLGVGMVGADPQVGFPRWAGNQLYLWGGVPLVPVTLGLFAIPEVIDLAIRGTRIADVPRAIRGVTAGIRDTMRSWFLVLRCSTLGVWIGFIPGLGASVVDWFAYGHAIQSEKGARETFGSGDVRGVIAPESANNAKEGGTLIPTIAFGVPGSAPMALLLAAFIIHGLQPGPDMLTVHLDVTYTMIWSLALANVIATAICLAFTPQLAKIASIRIHLIAPLVISFVFLAAYQASSNLGDIVVLLIFGVLGWLMKQFGWPRPPLILGLVLSGVLETYLFISMRLYGMEWLTRPFVLAIAAVIVASLYYGLRKPSAKAEPKPAE